MIWAKLAISFGLALIIAGLCALAWHLRITARARAIAADFPPIGQFITIDGARLHYKTSGAGPHIVLIHGASGNLREWEFGLRAALEARFTITAFDRPGHGHSEAVSGGAHLAAQAAHLHQAMQALGIINPILVGHSYGGSLALAMALQQRPKAMVLISAPALPWPGQLDLWYRLTASRKGRALFVSLAAAVVSRAYVARMTEAVFAPQLPPATYLRKFGAMLAIRAPSLAANTAQVNALLGDITAQMARYSTLDMPIALIHGTDDSVVPLAIHAAKLAPLLARARLTVLQGAGHMPHHQHLDAVLDAITQVALP